MRSSNLRDPMILLVIVIYTAAVYYLDVYLTPGIVLPVAPYAIAALAAAYFLSTRLALGVALFVFGVQTMAAWVQQEPFLSVALDLASFSAIALLGIALAINLKRYAALARERGQLLDQVREINGRLVAAGTRIDEEAKEAERQATRLRALLESMAEGVMLFDKDGLVFLMNDAARAITRASDEQGRMADDYRALGFNLMNLDGTPISPEEWIAFRVVRRGERVTRQEAIFVFPDGSQKQVVSSGSALLDKDGKVEAAIVVYRDVTELRRLQQSRQEYASLISHDLRNPLAVIIGSVQFLQRVLKTARVRASGLQAVEGIAAAADRMNAMIQDLVDSIHLESGQLQLNKERVDVSAIGSELLQRHAPIGDWRRVRLDFNENMPPAEIDPVHLERILVNLITNALKYSNAESEVVVRGERKDEELLISVSDHGPGIRPDELPRIFDRFTEQGCKRPPAGWV